MRRTLLSFFILFLTISSNVVIAEEVHLLKAYKHNGESYPPVFFVTNIKDDSFKLVIQEYGAFTELDEKAVGLPIGVRVLKGYRTKQDGTQFTTMMLSASTLGILPVVSNKEFKVRYDVFVQGESIANFEYMMDSTDVNNIWTSSYKDRKATPTEEIFLKDTVAQFLLDLQKEKKSQAVFAEYKEYFQ